MLHGFPWFEQVARDAAFVVRSLCRARGFTLTVLTMLVSGIGVATVMFRMTAWLLIFAQPYPQPEQLFLLGSKDKHSDSNPYRPAVYFQAYREQTSAVFSEFAAVTNEVANVVIDSAPVGANVMSASLDCFRTLGVQPVLGRGFLAEEHVAGAAHVVVITDMFWRRHFNASPDVLGRQILIDQQTCTVVGVLGVSQTFPPTFGGDVYRPMVTNFDPANPFSPVVFIIGRLRPGVPVEQARVALASVTVPTLPAWATAYLAEQEPILIRPTDLVKPETFWVTGIAALLLYAIACLNVTNLTLVRLLGRRRELGIRLALGATRWQILRLLVFESVGLAFAASLIVALASRWIFPWLFVRLTGSEAMRYTSYWDGRTLGCIVTLSVVAALAVAIVPVWRLWRTEINPGLKDGGAAGESRGVGRLRAALVIFQAAFAVVLLAAAGLMVRSFEKLHRTDLGFDPAGKFKVMVSFPRGREPKPEARLQLFEKLQQRLAAIPGVRGVSFGQDSLLVGGFWGTAELLMHDGTKRQVAGVFSDDNLPRVAGLTVTRGRWLSAKRGQVEVVINESLARARFGDEDPIGQSLRLAVSDSTPHLVVGVVRDVRDSVRSSPGLRFYIGNWIYPANITTLLLRLDRDPEEKFAAVVRRAIYEVDETAIPVQLTSINNLIGNQMWAERNALRMLKGLSLIALALAIVGLFSVMTYNVDSRMKEFGVRLALGARPADVRRLVLRRGVSTAAFGVVLGVAGALGLTRFMQSLLFETTPHDPLVYGIVAVLLLVAAAIACWLPARRAARVDITRLLRTE